MKSSPVLTGFARFLILHFVNRWIQYFVLRFQCLLPVLTFDAQGSPHSHRGKPCLPPAPSSSTASAWYPLPAWRQKTDPRERLERHAAQVLLGPTTTPGLHRPAVWDVSKRSLESSSGARVWGASILEAHVLWGPRLPTRWRGPEQRVCSFPAWQALWSQVQERPACPTTTSRLDSFGLLSIDTLEHFQKDNGTPQF